MTISVKLQEKIGLLRSRAMYYWKPFNRRRLMRFYGQFIKEGDLCFDVGAHLGNRTDAWLHLNAKIIAIEPQPACLDYLYTHFGKKSKVTIVPEAVSDQIGESEMHVSSLTPTVSTLADKLWRDAVNENTSFEVKWDQKVIVPLTTLDALIERFGKPHFCKIDVENLEVEVLKGLSQPIEVLSFEFLTYTPERTLACLEMLDRLGNYQFNWSKGESQHFESKNWLNTSEMVSIIKNIAQNSFSGDIYAQLQTIHA